MASEETTKAKPRNTVMAESKKRVEHAATNASGSRTRGVIADAKAGKASQETKRKMKEQAMKKSAASMAKARNPVVAEPKKRVEHTATNASGSRVIADQLTKQATKAKTGKASKETKMKKPIEETKCKSDFACPPAHICGRKRFIFSSRAPFLSSRKV